MSLSVPMKDENGRQYSRDSFDRFGDDLTELLLSFLSFKDKFRYECVSKQWRRLVFNKVIYFDDFSLFSYLPPNERDVDVKLKHLNSALKKCPNVKTIKLYVRENRVPFLSIFSDNCHRLKSIRLKIAYGVSMEAMTAFGQTHGFKVETINTLYMSNSTEMLNWFPNLKRLKFEKYDEWLSLIGNDLVPELIHLDRVSVESDQMSAFIQLMDKYEKTLKNISVSFGKDCNISLVFQQLCRLKQLECLHIIISGDIFTPLMSPNQRDLTPKLLALSQNCFKLSKIRLETLNGKFLLSRPSKPITSIKSLNLYMSEIPDNLFANLSLLTPNLKEFKFRSSNYKYTNNDLIDLSQMKHLKRLVLSAGIRDQLMEESAVIHLLDNCKELKELNLWFRSNITEKTINRLKKLAIIRHKEKFKFLSVTSGNQSSELRQSLTETPNNLSIILK